MNKPTIRFAVGVSDGLQSAVWRAWTGSDGSVYISARPIAGHFKASLHVSGRWRVGFTTQHVTGSDPLVPPGQNRKVFDLSRPSEFAPGLTRAFAVLCAPSELRRIPDASRRPVVWLPPPKPNAVVEVQFIVTSREFVVGDWPGRREVGAHYVGQLPHGREQMWIVAWSYLDTPQSYARREANRAAVLTRFANLPAAAKPESVAGVGRNYRALTFGTLADGSGAFEELVIEPRG